MACTSWIAVSSVEVGQWPALFSCQLCRTGPNLLDWQDSMCGHVCVILSHPRDGLQEGTHTASQEGCCGWWASGWAVVRLDGKIGEYGDRQVWDRWRLVDEMVNNVMDYGQHKHLLGPNW